MINISLILPFRERVQLLEEMFQSLIKESYDLSKIEVLIMIDWDEPKIDEFLDIRKRYNEYLDIKSFRTRRSEHFTKDYINPLARKARGRWVIAINDDCDFLTPQWDRIIHEDMSKHAEKIGDDIIIGLPNDQIDRHGENDLYPHFSCWTVVPKEVINVLGFMWDERCMVWGPDHIISDVFKMLDGNVRRVSLVHVTIGHKSTHTKRRDVNENYDKFRDIDKRYSVEIGKLDHTESLNKLKKACKS